MKEHINGIALCLFELIVGILLLIDHESFTAGIIMLAGIALIILGIIEVVKYFRTSIEEAMTGQTLAKGLLSLIGGGFCLFEAGRFTDTFRIFTIIYGIIILVIGIGKLQLTVDMLRQKNKKWFWAGFSALISVVCAVIILKSPSIFAEILWTFIGVSLIAEGVLDIVILIMRNTSMKGNDE